MGVTLDSRLTFTQHVEKIRRKAFPKIRTLGTIRSFVSKETSVYLYKSLVLSQIDYADILYDGLNQTQGQYLQRLQNTGLRTVLNCDPRTPIDELHKRAGIKTLKERRRDHVCQYVYRGIHGLSTPRMNEMFSPLESVHNRNTRAVVRGDLAVPAYNLSISRRCFAYRGAVYYNMLDNNVRDAPTLNQLKEALKDPG